MAKRAVSSLEKMSLADLAQLRRSIDAAVQKRVSAERKILQSQIDALDALNGSDAGHTQSRRPRRNVTVKNRRVHPLKGKKAPVKFRGPGGETWSGRGLAPRWLAELEAKGKKRESYLIKG
jgi:DNA-binding protein H-NS